MHPTRPPTWSPRPVPQELLPGVLISGTSSASLAAVGAPYVTTVKVIGSHGRVAKELGGCIDVGLRTFVLEIPPTHEDLDHIGIISHDAAVEAS
jgi:hypothetical protein